MCHRSTRNRPASTVLAATWLGGIVIVSLVAALARSTWGIVGSAADGSHGAPPGNEPPRAGTETQSPNVRVVVYTTSWCPVCKRAKAWMKTQGIPFDERDVETSATYAREMRAINPRGGVPTFQIEGQLLVGFDARQITSTMEREAERRRMQ